MQNSTLKEHSYNKGVFRTKIVELFEGKFSEQNWYQNRLPEYLWISLILEHYGRQAGLEKLDKILKEFVSEDVKLETLRFSEIINSPQIEQVKIFKIILDAVDIEIFGPLTMIMYSELPSYFLELFDNTDVIKSDRLIKLSDTIKEYCEGPSEKATDVRYVVVLYIFYKGKIKVFSTLKHIVDQLMIYPKLEHEDPSMLMIRPTIRSMELFVLAEISNENSINYITIFWGLLYMLSECKLICIPHDENEEDVSLVLQNAKSLLETCSEIIIQSYPFDKKRIVSIGLAIFAYKRFVELHDKDLTHSITGRTSLRCMIECYLMLKYLLLKETDRPLIWDEYQSHGIGKYKFIFEKYSEHGNGERENHVDYEYLNLLVNEYKDKEFVSMDVRFFDGLNIRSIAEEVDEKKLYTLYYDYDSSFEHGLWGAIRESSFLKCLNANHLYHYVPDVENTQTLKSVSQDSIFILGKIMDLVQKAFS